VEKVVEGEMKQRESAVTEQINEAARKVKAGTTTAQSTL